MLGKVGTSATKIVNPEGAFLWWRLLITRLQPMLSTKSAIYVEDGQWQGLCVPNVKTTTYVSNRPQNKTNYIKFKTKVLKEINPNLGGLSRGLFLPPCSNETTSLKTISLFELVYISCISYIRLLWPMSVLTKKLSRIKKVSIKVFLN